MLYEQVRNWLRILFKVLFSGKDCVAVESSFIFFLFFFFFPSMQAMDLLKLHHSNICAYKELFVIWNNEVRMK